MRKMKFVAPRVLGESNELTLRINWMYAMSADLQATPTLRAVDDARGRHDRAASSVAHTARGNIERHLQASRWPARARGGPASHRGAEP